MPFVALLLAELHERGIELAVRGGRLVTRPGGALTPELRAGLLAHRAKVVERVHEAQCLERPPVEIVEPTDSAALPENGWEGLA